MKYMLNEAIKIAAVKHAGQFDHGGNPYILHCLKVMHYTNSNEEEVLCIAILHDIIEDTDVTYQDLRDIGMTERIINGVRCLTKIPGETYDEYKEKVKSNKDARRVKKADLKHNSDIRRLKGVTEKDIRRTVKYHHFYSELEELDNGSA